MLPDAKHQLERHVDLPLRKRNATAGAWEKYTAHVSRGEAVYMGVSMLQSKSKWVWVASSYEDYVLLCFSLFSFHLSIAGNAMFT